MFIKAKLSFKNKTVFESDFQPNVDRAFCIVSKMLFNNRINVDGSINVEQAAMLRKYELWSYIYYLYYHNNSIIDEFQEMQEPSSGKASAVRFYKVVRETVQNPLLEKDSFQPLDPNTLIYFINILVHKYGQDMMNPVVVYLQQLLTNKEAIAKLKTITLVTGRPEKNVEIISDPEKIASTNVKIRVIEKNT